MVVFDPRLPEYIANPHPVLHRLRAEDPVHRSAMGFWILTRYEDVFAALRNLKFGGGRSIEQLRSTYGDGAVFAYMSRRLSNYDPPDHTRLRSLVTRAFTARRVEGMRAPMQFIADRLLDATGDAPQIDVIADLAGPLPSAVICEMLGVPEVDWPRLSAWTHALHFILAPLVEPARLAAAETAADEFMEYVDALIKQRRTNLGDDLLSALLAAEDDGGKLSGDEVIATVVFLFSAGHATTRDLIGNGLLALLHNRTQWAHLVADPSLIPAAVEECLRYEPSITFVPRKVREVLFIAGTQISAGDQLFLSITAANRDPARFPDPDRFDLGRPRNEHLAFGGGIHYCLGATLARTEVQIAFGALLHRYPELELATDTIEWQSTISFRGLKTLPVKVKS